MAGLRVPLSTLRPRPRGHQRMTRGQDGSLHLSCTAVASATPCRFIPALTLTPLDFPRPVNDPVDYAFGLPPNLRSLSDVIVWGKFTALGDPCCEPHDNKREGIRWRYGRSS